MAHKHFAENKINVIHVWLYSIYIYSWWSYQDKEAASTLQSIYFSSICLNIQKEVYTNRIYMDNVTVKS